MRNHLANLNDSQTHIERDLRHSKQPKVIPPKQQIVRSGLFHKLIKRPTSINSMTKREKRQYIQQPFLPQAWCHESRGVHKCDLNVDCVLNYQFLDRKTTSHL